MTEDEKKLAEREKALAQREKAVAEREAAVAEAKPVEAGGEDLTPTPTQAENDAAKLGQFGKVGARYKTRDEKAG